MGNAQAIPTTMNTSGDQMPPISSQAPIIINPENRTRSNAQANGPQSTGTYVHPNADRQAAIPRDKLCNEPNNSKYNHFNNGIRNGPDNDWRQLYPPQNVVLCPGPKCPCEECRYMMRDEHLLAAQYERQDFAQYSQNPQTDSQTGYHETPPQQNTPSVANPNNHLLGQQITQPASTASVAGTQQNAQGSTKMKALAASGNRCQSNSRQQMACEAGPPYITRVGYLPTSPNREAYAPQNPLPGPTQVCQAPQPYLKGGNSQVSFPQQNHANPANEHQIPLQAPEVKPSMSGFSRHP